MIYAINRPSQKLRLGVTRFTALGLGAHGASRHSCGLGRALEFYVFFLAGDNGGKIVFNNRGMGLNYNNLSLVN